MPTLTIFLRKRQKNLFNISSVHTRAQNTQTPEPEKEAFQNDAGKIRRGKIPEKISEAYNHCRKNPRGKLEYRKIS